MGAILVIAAGGLWCRKRRAEKVWPAAKKATESMGPAQMRDLSKAEL
jgi:hypothetical protein